MVLVESPPTRRTATARGRAYGWAWLSLSSLAIAAAFGGQYATGLYDVAARTPDVDSAAKAFDGRAWPIEGGLWLHIVFASTALALGPLQFAGCLRVGRPRAHRWVGRAYLGSVALAAVGGVVTSLYSTLGLRGFFGFAALDVLWLWTAHRGYAAVRERRFQQHQAWMMRNFALTYAAVTLRIEFALLLAVQAPFQDPGTFPHAYDQAYGPLPYLAWIPNLVVAEFMIRRRNLPGLRMTDSSGAQLPPRARRDRLSAWRVSPGGSSQRMIAARTIALAAKVMGRPPELPRRWRLRTAWTTRRTPTSGLPTNSPPGWTSWS